MKFTFGSEKLRGHAHILSMKPVMPCTDEANFAQDGWEVHHDALKFTFESEKLRGHAHILFMKPVMPCTDEANFTRDGGRVAMIL